MEAAKGHQLRVPEDIAVVGIDGIPAANRDVALYPVSILFLVKITTTWENGSQLDRQRYQENGNRTKVRKATENFASEEILGQFQFVGLD
jgi:hypothetical protein